MRNGEFIRGGDYVRILHTDPAVHDKLGLVTLREKGGWLSINVKSLFMVNQYRFHVSAVEKITTQSHPEYFI